MLLIVDSQLKRECCRRGCAAVHLRDVRQRCRQAAGELPRHRRRAATSSSARCHVIIGELPVGAKKRAAATSKEVQAASSCSQRAAGVGSILRQQVAAGSNLRQRAAGAGSNVLRHVAAGSAWLLLREQLQAQFVIATASLCASPQRCDCRAGSGQLGECANCFMYMCASWKAG